VEDRAPLLTKSLHLESLAVAAKSRQLKKAEWTVEPPPRAKEREALIKEAYTDDEVTTIKVTIAKLQSLGFDEEAALIGRLVQGKSPVRDFSWGEQLERDMADALTAEIDAQIVNDILALASTEVVTPSPIEIAQYGQHIQQPTAAEYSKYGAGIRLPPTHSKYSAGIRLPRHRSR
jgi:hypothetical protein